MEGTARPQRRRVPALAGRSFRAAVADDVATVLWRRAPRVPVIWPQGFAGFLVRVLYAATTLGLAVLVASLLARPRADVDLVGVAVLTGVAAAAMAVAPWRPLAGWRVVLAAQVGVLFLSEQTPFGPPVAVGIGGVLVVIGLRYPTRTAVVAGVLSVLVGLLVATVVQDDAARWGSALVLVPLLVTANVRTRRMAGLAVAAEQQHAAEALEERARLAERARIAREMHDIVAHHMSLVAVRCETAPYRIPDLGGPASTELGEIAAAARVAMSEMQSLLGVLRSTDQAVDRAPQPGLDQLPGLLAEARAGGAALDWTVSVDRWEVPAALGLTVFRLVQQALTNAAQHARGAPVTVVVERSGNGLHVAVRNGPRTGAAVPTTGGGGHGLVGMRERASLHGGRLAAGPTADGGFAVSVELPLPAGPVS